MVQSWQKGPATLILLGVDTVSSIYINKDLVGTTDNMFRQYYFDITSSLAQGDNQIKVIFISPVTYAKEQHYAYQHKYGYTPPPSCPPHITHGECHVNFIRKMQASFSWDWGPAFPTMGFHKDLWIDMSQPCFIDSISGVPTYLKPQNRWILHAEMFLYCHGTDFGADRAGQILLPDLKFEDAWLVQGSELKVGLNRIYKSLIIPENPDLKLWWPNGYGEPHMYKMVASILSGKGESEILKAETKIAFRHVELIQEPIPGATTIEGLTFYFRVNSLPIFLKGTNWIPGDSFQTRISEDKLRFIFKSMQEVNMNSMRVWGGGMYEPDIFYDVADEHGILIWQDMMFACASYPGNPEFIENAKSEVHDQIRGLKRHPSILVWAGNNENDGHKGSSLDADYIKLYKNTIWKVVNESDFASRPYLFASPSNGIKTVQEGGISSNPGNSRFGDIHFYNYRGNAWDHKTFPTPRCCTEYGYQSLPSKTTLKSAIPKEEDWSYFSAAVEHRQHHMGGTYELVQIPLSHFKTPRCISDKGKGVEYEHGKEFFKTYCPNPVEKDEKKAEALFLDDLIYLNQIHQARAYQTETEHYRRFRNRTDPSGLGYTMCALYWQLNDIWQAPTWSTIDWGLKWKMAHYYAKDFFAPLIISPYMENNQLFIAISSDLQSDISGLTVIVDLLPWKHEFKPTHSFNVSVPPIPAFTAKVVYNHSVENLCKLAGMNFVKDANANPLKLEDFVIRMRLVNSTHRVAPEQVVLTTDFRKINPEVYGKVAVEDVHPVSGKNSQFEVGLKATGIAPYVWLEMKYMIGYFDKNGFTMTTEKDTVIFNSWMKKSLEEIKSELEVKSLRDLYP